MRQDEDWAARYRVAPSAVTDSTGQCVGETPCGVVRDGDTCVDLCRAARQGRLLHHQQSPPFFQLLDLSTLTRTP